MTSSGVSRSLRIKTFERWRSRLRRRLHNLQVVLHGKSGSNCNAGVLPASRRDSSAVNADTTAYKSPAEHPLLVLAHSHNLSVHPISDVCDTTLLQPTWKPYLQSLQAGRFHLKVHSKTRCFHRLFPLLRDRRSHDRTRLLNPAAGSESRETLRRERKSFCCAF